MPDLKPHKPRTVSDDGGRLGGKKMKKLCDEIYKGMHGITAEFPTYETASAYIRKMTERGWKSETAFPCRCPGVYIVCVYKKEN